MQCVVLLNPSVFLLFKPYVTPHSSPIKNQTTTNTLEVSLSDQVSIGNCPAKTGSIGDQMELCNGVRLQKYGADGIEYIRA